MPKRTISFEINQARNEILLLGNFDVGLTDSVRFAINTVFFKKFYTHGK